MTAISDPRGTNGTSASFAGYGIDVSAVALTAVSQYDLVAVRMATDGEITVRQYDTDNDDPATKAGVALESIAADGVGQVRVWGPALVNIGSGTVAATELVIGTTTAGVADGVAADATTINGDSHGVFMTDEVGTDNRAWAWIR